jgi:hypothetical protein
MPTGARRIFVSYARADERWKDLVCKHLDAVGEHEEHKLPVWQDGEIRAGDEWHEAIQGALRQARIALMLLSTDFLTSEYVKRYELFTLLERCAADGLRVIPVAVSPCALSTYPSLARLQVRPDPRKTLSEMSKGARERALVQLANEIAAMLAEEAPVQGTRPESVDARARVERLFERTLCRPISDPLESRAAKALAALLVRLTHFTDERLFDAARVAIEIRLLEADGDPNCVVDAHGRVGFDDRWESIRQQLEEALRLSAKPASLPRPRRKVKAAEFLRRTLDRAEDWSRYFEALRSPEIGAGGAAAHETFCDIEVNGGAFAPQYLLAGMMSHFHDDWWPVIRGYRAAASRFDEAPTAFERLRASQWICWLVWGPSVPICECSHWRPQFAYQYGYGDENNSLPALVLEGAAGRPALATALRGRGAGDRRAFEAGLEARLVWGPQEHAAADAFAPAQVRFALDAGGGGADRGVAHASDGLMLKVHRVTTHPAGGNRPSYFTAYIWYMFWISAADGDDAPPRRLDGSALPEPRPPGGTREAVRGIRLHQDLLPVFIHANILDPVALRFQRGMLVEVAVHVLREAWAANEAARGTPEARAIEFHLVCASDYSGCGHDLLMPPSEDGSLVELLRHRLGREQEAGAAFAAAVRLPSREGGSYKPPPPFRSVLSACHLPELIDDYYEDLAQILSHEQA